MFSFQGRVPASKSHYNRALIVKSFFPQLRLWGDSRCDDVQILQKALKDLATGQTHLNCGEAGTVIRFLALRVSRLPGRFLLVGSERLLARPQAEITRSLEQLGVHCDLTPQGLEIIGQGWQCPKTPLVLRIDQSSQFASALLLSSWQLPWDLHFEFVGVGVSQGYWQMTLDFCQSLGMKIEKIDHPQGPRFRIPAGQTVTASEAAIESDYSSAFAVAALAAIFGQAELAGFSTDSLQPDAVFPEILKKYGANVRSVPARILVANQGELLGQTVSLQNCPDLFPVLAALSAYAKGESRLVNAPQLAFKESNRIVKTAELLKRAGVRCEILPDGLIVHGQGKSFQPSDFVFDPDHDHRMAMAAALFRHRNRAIHILNPEVVNKSYPEFWTDIDRSTPYFHLVVGHRGVGKSSVGKMPWPEEHVWIDLDDQIERRTGKNPQEIFRQAGENEFRTQEHLALQEVINEQLRELKSQGPRDIWIVLGAGFELDRLNWPRDLAYEVVWFRRQSDARGRVFMDRPRLNAETTPLNEYLQRFPLREKRYATFAHRWIELPEGEHRRKNSRLAKLLMADAHRPVEKGEGLSSGVFTLRAEDRGRSWLVIDQLRFSGLQAFELRSDLLSADDIFFWLKILPWSEVLLAIRKPGDEVLFHSLQERMKEDRFWGVDWALELGAPPAEFLRIPSQRHVISFHGKDATQLQDWSQWQKRNSGVHLKWAPELETWSELSDGQQWQLDAPGERSFLPRSRSGRWAWFRQWMLPRQMLNFVREKDSSETPDQPTWLEALDRIPLQGEGFAAILGDPVDHSWTPGEQADYFATRGFPVLRIPVTEAEWNSALPILQRMGLVAAAVTSPLKRAAFDLCTSRDRSSERFRSVNTLILRKEEIQGANTDYQGLVVAWRKVCEDRGITDWPGPIRVWGGGGTLEVLRSVFPQAEYFSVRTGQRRDNLSDSGADGSGRLDPVLVRAASDLPVLWVWAAGPRDELPPLASLSAKDLILDLNYREDSRAREWAISCKAGYVSGEMMFYAQAEGQRAFWQNEGL